MSKILNYILFVFIVVLAYSCNDNLYDNGEEDILSDCEVNVTSNGYGRVNIEKEIVKQGELFTIEAKANKGYVFKYWSVNNQIVGIESVFRTKVDKDTEFRAYFQNENTNVQAVDLGLSVKWADCNIGASSPEEYGDFFAWGEIAQKESIDYFWERYKFCYGSYKELWKYNSDANLGYIDNKSILEKEDDAAYSVFGENWRLPSKGEYEELKSKCNWQWTQNNGVYGYVIEGLNGNSIFLPVTGYFAGATHNIIDKGYYWCNENIAIATNDAYSLIFSQENVEIKSSARKNGLPIRSVLR